MKNLKEKKVKVVKKPNSLQNNSICNGSIVS